MVISSFKDENSFLSSFAPARVYSERFGIWFPTVEHGYQALKTTSHSERLHIAGLSTPGKAKRAGRKVTLREDWEKIRVPVMRMLVRQKFSDPEMAAKLLATGDHRLVEGNYWHDQFWGDCTCPKHIFVEGQNMLGKILMLVREELRCPE